MANRTTMSTKGQVIIPSTIRQSRGWKPGTELVVEETDDGAVVLRLLPVVPATTLDEVVGCTNYSGPERSLEQMNEAIEKGARDR